MLKNKCFCVLTMLFIPLQLYGSTPKTKTYQTQQDFQNGELKGLSVNHKGEISLSPLVTEVPNVPLSFIWASEVDSRGNLYVTGGSEGKVYRIDKNGRAELIFQAEEPQVYALAIDSHDNIYIGSSPNGKVYKLSPAQNSKFNSSDFFEPEQLYIWALAFNSQNELLVATGENGKIFKLDKSGNGTLFYECDDRHVLKIIPEKGGSIIAGTSEKGLVLRIDGKGKAFVLFDSPLEEITDLFVQGGNVYAAATGGSQFVQRGGKQVVTEQANKESDEQEDTGDEDVIEVVAQPVTAAGGSGAGQNGELYKMEPSGAIQKFETLLSEHIFCLAAANDHELLLGTGRKGRVYKMQSNGDMVLLSTLGEMQITSFATDASGKVIYICTSNAGKVYRLQDASEKQGEFISEVYDAEVVSQWGALTWETSSDGGKIVLHTRSGNTTEPDRTWSDWSPGYTVSSGSVVQSPPARFLQVKAILSAKNDKQKPLLREISFSHLQKNLPPAIKQIYVHNPGEYYPESNTSNTRNSRLSNGSTERNGYTAQSFGRKSYQKGYRSVSWIVDDPNGDNLSFDLFYKAVEDRNWKELIAGQSGAAVYSWDSELMPDGRFELKLIARDDLSNPPSMVFSSEKLSAPFVVDNTGPQVSELEIQTNGNKTTLVFSINDMLTNITTVEYSINAAQWQLLYPTDGICDSRKETFEIKLEKKVEPGRSIVIKAQDELGNIGYGKKKI